ncbi:hypothetical protein K2P97_12250 [bacterium]|nr:hypothetical protein [bacterium]
MSASSISENDAFNEGAKLWIIKNDPNLNWWKKLDIHSKYLLSENYLKKERSTVFELQTIINATNLKISKSSLAQNHLLLGTEDHFLNKWILLWSDLNETELADLICETTSQLKTDTIRLFSNSEILKKLQTRPTASSLNISYIENT